MPGILTDVNELHRLHCFLLLPQEATTTDGDSTSGEVKIHCSVGPCSTISTEHAAPCELESHLR